MLNDRETICHICHSIVTAKSPKIGDIAICFKCKAEFDVTADELRYIQSTGAFLEDDECQTVTTYFKEKTNKTKPV